MVVAAYDPSRTNGHHDHHHDHDQLGRAVGHPTMGPRAANRPTMGPRAASLPTKVEAITAKERVVVAAAAITTAAKGKEEEDETAKARGMVVVAIRPCG